MKILTEDEASQILSEAGYSREKTVIGYTPDGIPITPENKFDDGIYAFLYNYWKEHSGEYDPKKDVIPESEMNKMHPKTKNEFQFEQWLFEQYGMTSKEKTENTLMGNLNVLLELSDVIDIAALPVGAIAVGAKLVGKKVIKEVGEELGEKAVKEVAEEAVEKTIKKETAEEVAENTAKKEIADTAESQKTVKKENTLEDSKPIKRECEVLEGSLNSYDEFSKAVSDIGTRTDLTDSQKITELQKIFKNSNYKTDINIPSDVQYVKGFDTKGNVIYDWSPKLGFDERTIKSISRVDGLPDTWDRYGYMGGSNFADVPSTGRYTYSERSIPYVENEAAYHIGTFNSKTYFDKIDAIKNGDINTLNNILSNEGIDMIDSSYFKNLKNTYNDFLEDTANAVGNSIDATYGLKGTAAPWGNMSGGAGQYVTPLNGTAMTRLGIINLEVNL